MTGLLHGFEALLAQYGAVALFLTIGLESLGAPLPGESALIAASTAAARGALPMHQVAVAAFLGAVAGDSAGYLIGRRLGREAVLRHGARFGVTDAGMARAEAIARRRGPLMVVAARFVVVLRQLNGIVAGTTGMPFPRFLLAAIAGGALWVGLWTTLVWHLGHDTHLVPLVWHHLSLVATVLVALVVGAMVALRLRRPAA